MFRSPAVTGPLRFPPSCRGKIMIDAGVNDGADTRTFLRRGYCVLGIDANPMVKRNAQDDASLTTFGTRLQLVTAGIDQGSRSAPFFVPRPSKLGRRLLTGDRGRQGAATLRGLNPWASFDRTQAMRSGDPNPPAFDVPIVRCEAILRLLPSRPVYLKLDIEERQYLCVEALRSLPRPQLPRYVSWEMHELAKGLSFPMLDTQLILMMHGLGYTRIKTLRHDSSSEPSAPPQAALLSAQPEEVMDAHTGVRAWRNVSALLKQGLGDPQRNSSWFDFYMALEEDGI